MFSALDISTSALVAQRVRLNAISSNLANMNTTVNEDGLNIPYQPRYPVFETDDTKKTAYGAVAVKVASVETEDVDPIYKHDPDNKLADANGMVAYPNINMTREFVDALEATRAYEANIGVMEVTKNITKQTLSILA